MRTRTITVALALLAAACGGSSGPETPRTPRVFHLGLFHVGLDHVPPSLPGLAEGLGELSYLTKEQVDKFKKDLLSLPTVLTIDGKKVQLDWRNLANEEAAGETVREFVRSKKDLIVAFEDQTIRAAKAGTTTIPTVFLHATDPVGNGFVASMSHPGGNLTGVIGFPVLTGKQLEMFKNVLPALHRVLILTDPTDPRAPAFLEAAETSAVSLKLDLVVRRVTDETEISRVFADLKPGEVDGVLSASQVVTTKFGELLIRLTREHRLPFMVADRSRVERGGLLSYGPDFQEVGRSGAEYVDDILTGANPAELPVAEVDLVLVINLKVGNELGLKLAPEWLDAANEVVSG